MLYSVRFPQRFHLLSAIWNNPQRCAIRVISYRGWSRLLKPNAFRRPAPSRPSFPFYSTMRTPQRRGWHLCMSRDMGLYHPEMKGVLGQRDQWLVSVLSQKVENNALQSFVEEFWIEHLWSIAILCPVKVTWSSQDSPRRSFCKK